MQNQKAKKRLTRGVHTKAIYLNSFLQNNLLVQRIEYQTTLELFRFRSFPNDLAYDLDHATHDTLARDPLQLAGLALLLAPWNRNRPEVRHPALDGLVRGRVRVRIGQIEDEAKALVRLLVVRSLGFGFIASICFVYGARGKGGCVQFCFLEKWKAKETELFYAKLTSWDLL